MKKTNHAFRATPTEAGALGSFIVLILALFGSMKWPTLLAALIETARLTVMLFSLIWGVLIFVRFMGFAELPATFAEWVTSPA